MENNRLERFSIVKMVRYSNWITLIQWRIMMLYQIEDWKTVKENVQKALNIKISREKFSVNAFDLPGTKMIKVPDFENLSDDELFQILINLHNLSGMLYVVTHICHKDGFGPFLLEANRLEGLVKNYVNIFQETFFDTNAIIISLNEKLVWMFHHSGFVGLFDYSKQLGI